MSHTSKRDQPTAARRQPGLQEDLQRLSRSWFPINPALLEQIQQGLRDSRYEANRSLLLTELKQDPSLFAYCLHRAAQLMDREGQSNAALANPIDLIRTAPADILKETFCIKADDISIHRFQDLTTEQAERLQQVLVTTMTTEALCDASDVKNDLGFLSALFRQLGLILIAWNYPHIYQRALYTADKSTFNTKLMQLLGYSPSMLGVEIARMWSLPDAVRGSIGDKRIIPTLAGESLMLSQQLDEFCRLGEGLAAAGSTKLDPAKAEDLCDIQRELQKRLGAHGINKLQDNILQSCQAHIEIAPKVFAVPTWTKAPAAELNDRAQQLLSRNPYLLQCPSSLRERVREVYASLTTPESKDETIILLTKHIMPAAGFPRGCAYLAAQSGTTLVPTISVGRSEINEFAPVDYYADESTFPAIVQALRRTTPLLEESTTTDGRPVTYISGLLGENQRSGVLYLEIAESLLEQVGSNPIARFKALRHVLCDCLDIF